MVSKQGPRRRFISRRPHILLRLIKAFICSTFLRQTVQVGLRHVCSAEIDCRSWYHHRRRLISTACEWGQITWRHSRQSPLFWLPRHRNLQSLQLPHLGSTSHPATATWWCSSNACLQYRRNSPRLLQLTSTWFVVCIQAGHSRHENWSSRTQWHNRPRDRRLWK